MRARAAFIVLFVWAVLPVLARPAHAQIPQDLLTAIYRYYEGKFTEAAALLEPLVAPGGNGTVARAYYASCLAYLGQSELAIEHGRTAVNEFVSVGATDHFAYGRAWDGYGGGFIREHRYRELIDELRPIMVARPDDAYPYFWRAQAYNGLRKIDLAVEDLSTFLKLCPKCPEAPSVRQTISALKFASIRGTCGYLDWFSADEQELCSSECSAACMPRSDCGGTPCPDSLCYSCPEPRSLAFTPPRSTPIFATPGTCAGMGWDEGGSDTCQQRCGESSCIRKQDCGGVPCQGDPPYCWKCESEPQLPLPPLAPPTPEPTPTPAVPVPRGIPSPLDPFGCIDTLRPRLTWTWVPDATHYNVVLIRTTPTGHDEEFLVNQTVDITSFQPDFDLLPGALYRWKVKAATSGGAGYYTDHQYFRVQCGTSTELAAPTPVLPTGTVNVSTPSVRWTTVPGAIEYFFTGVAVGGRTLRAWYPAWACDANSNTCAVRAEAPAPNGTYQWSVHATDGVRRGPASALQTFTIDAPPPTISVNGHEGPLSLTAGTSLQVIVAGGAGNTNDVVGIIPTPSLDDRPVSWSYLNGQRTMPGLGLHGATLSFTAPLSPGDYFIRFSARDGRVPLTEIPLKVVRILIEPGGSIPTASPTYRWNAITGVSEYRLWIERASDGAVLHQGSYAAQGVCTGAICETNPQVFLPAGAYRWSIQLGGAAGHGPWSDSLSFETILPAPTLLAPGSGYQSATPTFQWTPVQGAQSYTLVVSGTTGVEETYGPHTCSSGTCVATPATTLAGGGYNWWVYASNEAGPGNSSATWSFAVPSSGPPGCNDLMCFDNLGDCTAGCNGGTCERRISCGGPTPETAHRCFCPK